jgi:parallel beta-helix repeat protein
MMYLTKLALLAVLFVSTFGASARDFYVAVNGNDANPGTKDKPVATLEAARDLVRQYKAIHEMPQEGITVWIREGQYYQKTPFLLNENDSGEPGSRVVWRANGEDEVRITGGINIPSGKFTSVTNKPISARLSGEAAEKVRQVSLKEIGITDFGQITQYGHAMPVTTAPAELFFNDEPMILARYPNEGYIKIGKVTDSGSVPRNRDYSGRGGIFEYTDDRHSVWAGQKDVWLQGTFNYGFADDNLLVESIDVKRKSIKTAMPSLYGIAGGREYQQYVAYNILEELDTPGEFYIDKSSGMLYFWPPGEMNGSSVMISVLEDPIICMEGARNITIRDVTVEVGRGIGIYLERGSGNLIAGCTVRNVGTSGIFMGQGAKQTFPSITHEDYEGVPVSRRIGNLPGQIYKYTTWDRKAGTGHGILSCDVYNTGSGGIYLSGGSKRKLIPGNNYVENCKIHNYNRRNKFLWAGINVDGCGNRVTHCEVFDSEWQGIYVNGNEHLFEYNHVHHVTLNSNDTSPWYIGRDPSDRGNVIRYNYFHHCGNPKRMNMGIYCDDSTTDVYVFGNVFYKMNTTHGVLFSNTGWDLKMENNIVVEPVSHTAVVSAHYYTWARNQAVPMLGPNGLIRRRLTESVNIYEPPYSERYPALVTYLDPVADGNEWEGMRSRRNVITKNVIVGGTPDPVSLLGGEHAQIEAINNYRTDNDPGFVDYEKGNFNLLPDSEVFEKIPGFKPIPFDRMGLYPDEFRKVK